MKLLVTGGAGFIGANFIRYILQARADVRIVNLDRLTYAGNLETLSEVAHDPRYSFVRGDITQRERVESCLDQGIDAVLNFAAETHVDRSILNPSTFIHTNVLGTQVLLEAARIKKISRVVQVSTDEVYGSLGPSGKFSEESPLAPNSPYAASKAAGDLLARACHETYRMDIVVTRCSNNYGPYQFPEKLIPLMILNALEGKSLPVYGDGLHVRDWIHVEDHCRALERVLMDGVAGRIYNIGSNQQKQNLEVVYRILEVLEKPRELIRFVKDRPGHDRRYAIDGRRIQQELGWSPRISFNEGLKATIQWYSQNAEWVGHVRSGAYRNYYDQMYENRDSTLANL